MIKESIQQEDTTTRSVYPVKIKAPTNIKQIFTDLKGEIDNNIIIIEKFNALLSIMVEHSEIKSIRKQQT